MIEQVSALVIGRHVVVDDLEKILRHVLASHHFNLGAVRLTSAHRVFICQIDMDFCYVGRNGAGCPEAFLLFA
jgi:hypothetical protein